MAQTFDRVHERLADEAREYAQGEERPLTGYVKIMGTYAASVAGLSALAAARKRRLPERPAPSDLALVALATVKLSRLATRGTVTSPLRAPFTRYEGVGGPAELTESVRGHGVRHSVGELLTCPFCMSQWIATGFTFGLIFSPRVTRQIAGLFSALEVADLTQFAHAIADKASS
jgi:hypothetical protein